MRERHVVRSFSVEFGFAIPAWDASMRGLPSCVWGQSRKGGHRSEIPSTSVFTIHRPIIAARADKPGGSSPRSCFETIVPPVGPRLNPTPPAFKPPGPGTSSPKGFKKVAGGSAIAVPPERVPNHNPNPVRGSRGRDSTRGGNTHDSLIREGMRRCWIPVDSSQPSSFRIPRELLPGFGVHLATAFRGWSFAPTPGYPLMPLQGRQDSTEWRRQSDVEFHIHGPRRFPFRRLDLDERSSGTRFASGLLGGNRVRGVCNASTPNCLTGLEGCHHEIASRKKGNGNLEFLSGLGGGLRSIGEGGDRRGPLRFTRFTLFRPGESHEDVADLPDRDFVRGRRDAVGVVVPAGVYPLDSGEARGPASAVPEATTDAALHPLAPHNPPPSVHPACPQPVATVRGVTNRHLTPSDDRRGGHVALPSPCAVQPCSSHQRPRSSCEIPPSCTGLRSSVGAPRRPLTGVGRSP
jgi:hypothetical protein